MSGTQVQRASATADLLRDVVETFVDQPERIEIDVIESFRGGRVVHIFYLRTCETENGLLIGKGGSQIKALTLFIAKAGQRAGGRYILSVGEPTSGGEPPVTHHPAPQQYDPEPALLLLSRMVDATVPECHVSVDRLKRDKNFFVFSISALSANAYSELLAPEMRIVPGVFAHALSTLLHARGMHDGVQLRLNVLRR